MDTPVSERPACWCCHAVCWCPCVKQDDGTCVRHGREPGQLASALMQYHKRMMGVARPNGTPWRCGGCTQVHETWADYCPDCGASNTDTPDVQGMIAMGALKGLCPIRGPLREDDDGGE